MWKKSILFIYLATITAACFSQVQQAKTFEEKKHGVIVSAVSNDGNLIATSGNDNNIIVWNILSGTIFRKLTGLNELTKAIAFSYDGRSLITGGKDSKVCVWDIDKGQLRYSLTGHSDDVNAVSVNFDNSLAASGSADKSIIIWDIRSGKLLATLPAHSKEVTSVHFSPNGTKLASASADGSIKIWNTSTWVTERTIDAHKDWVRCVKFSPDGSLIATCGDDKTVKIFDGFGNLKFKMSGHKDRVTELSFSPDGNFLVSGSFDQRFILWNVATGTEVYRSNSLGEIIYSISFNPNGKTLVTTNLYKDEFILWDVSSLNIASNVSPAQAPQTNIAQAQTNVPSQVVSSFEPPSLQIAGVNFTDANRNSVIDAGEQAAVELTIVNSGKGAAQAVKLYFSEQNNVKGINFSQVHDLGSIQPGTQRTLKVPITAAEHLETSNANFRISITESMGTTTNPVDFAIETRKLTVPLVVVHEYAIEPINSSIVTKGSKFKLSMIIQNKGDAVARIIKVKFGIPENAFIVSDPEFTISELSPQEFKKLEVEVMTNTRYIRPDVPIEIFVTESTGKYGDRKIASAQFGEGPQGDINSIYLASAPSTAVGSSNVTFSTVSDVDRNIPQSPVQKSSCYALIIGNEDYSSYQQGLTSEVNVEFARNDAKIFKEYVNKTLGVPEENIMLLLDAKVIEFNRCIEKLNLIAKTSGGNCELIFYFAGHGLPDEVTKDAYLMPVDVSGNDLKYAIKLSELYAKLSEHPTKKVTVFLDACFSGGARNDALVAARGVKVRPKKEAIKGNVVVFSASSGEQSSLPYKDKQHGIFTYHLLKKLQETKGDASLQEISEYLSKEVSLRSIIVNNKEQNPQVNYSTEVQEKWGSWKLK
ncbi:MAG TPA: caspase family protein [Tenuifilaceae bacterium]|nr:caspase family protein [Tenuifilaceae bacterium]HPE17641.1 caspase family protein [Tenuifilaceae bacterium]HPJ44956.1 caspase family protein [Tenuifilaceae bacterium]HPQ35094.1 caspase family protein [Tenuifilaceae bacterium]HRX68231.1 caspase family protein [Tenuifilaceae bacterium]